MSGRPEDHVEGKKSASQIMTSLLLKRHMESEPMQTKGDAGQDLQELYQVVDSENSSAVGDYWCKLTRGTKCLGDRKLSRVAHQAVLNRQMTIEDYGTLQMTSGGHRLLQMIGGLLVENHAGAEMNGETIARRVSDWEQARIAVNKRRSTERKLLRAKIKSANTKVVAALTSLNSFAEFLKSTKFFDVLYRPDGAVAGTHNEEPYVGPAEQFLTHLESLRNATAIGRQAFSEARVEERINHGFADLPTIDPRGKDSEASLMAAQKRLMDALPEDWDDDNSGKITVARKRGYTRLLPSGTVRKLVHVQKAPARRAKKGRRTKPGKLQKPCHVSATESS